MQLRQSERGEDASFEFTAAIVPMVIMISLIAFATLVRASQMPAWTAASECARAAIATLDESLGEAQGRRAALNSLSGNFINTDDVNITVIYDAWERGSTVTCKVAYDIDVSGIYLLAEMYPDGVVPMSAEVTLRVERFKSRWSGG